MWGCADSCTLSEELGEHLKIFCVAQELLSTEFRPLTLSSHPALKKTINSACGNAPHNEGNHLRSIYWALYFVALISFTCRLLARSKRFGGIFWWDDWFIIASFVTLTAVSIGAELMVVFGLGQDTWNLNDTKITIVLIVRLFFPHWGSLPTKKLVLAPCLDPAD